MFYNARWYDPALGRFVQADTIVPGGVQGLDRYAYVNNSPMNYADPSGHYGVCVFADSNNLCLQWAGIAGSHGMEGMSDSQANTIMAVSETLWNLGIHRDEEDDAQQAMEYVVATEYGVGIGNYSALDEAMTRRYHQYCSSGGAWSSDCMIGFWGYMEMSYVGRTPEGAQELINHTNKVIEIKDVSAKAGEIFSPANEDWKSECTNVNLCHWATIDPRRNNNFYNNYFDPFRYVGGYIESAYFYAYPTGYNDQILVVLNMNQVLEWCSDYGYATSCSIVNLP